MADDQVNEGAAVPTAEAADVSESDIVFDCPHCQKSLAIDYRGAGLMITCPDCANRIQVPIPEGMEVTDLDASDDEQRVRTIHLREALVESQRTLLDMQAEIAKLQQRRVELEAQQTEWVRRWDRVMEEVARIRRSHAEITSSIDRICELRGESGV